jgi:xanthine/CO dehydrogenase XdhC/CoxF family maturation factor
MKELQVITEEVERLRAAGRSAVLATVVGVRGSAYRVPGARMLVADEAWAAGSISGGCLEGDVVLRAPEVIGRDQALVVTYDTTSDEDIIFGVGLGCRGVIDILVEPVTPRRGPADLVEFVRGCLARRESGIAATVIRVDDGVDARTGSRILLRADGERFADVCDGALAAAIDARLQQTAGDAQLVRLATPGGNADVFIERIEPPTPLVVFGAGHDAIPVVRLAKELGWHVTVVDHRPAYATSERFPLADEVRVASLSEPALPDVKLDARTLTLIMTHNYLRDLNILKILMASPVRYVGLLGPRQRLHELLDELGKQAAELTPERLRRLYAPVGLDIGGEGPEGVALSIIAEMQAVIARRAAGHLRDRTAPIHGKEAVENAG